MQKKSIYVAYTGGTIGMQRSEHGYIPVSGHLQRQLALMPEFHRPEMPDFTIHEYAPLIDSSDMTPEDWQHIADDIKQNYDRYDGFVILHGTDTMAFTASALSFMLENLAKPVIVTGSQIPLAELRSDGQTNLLNALYLAANHPVNEVSLFFNNKLFRGNRTTKAHADGFDAFASPTCRRCWKPVSTFVASTASTARFATARCRYMTSRRNRSAWSPSIRAFPARWCATSCCSRSRR